MRFLSVSVGILDPELPGEMLELGLWGLPTHGGWPLDRADKELGGHHSLMNLQ